MIQRFETIAEVYTVFNLLFQAMWLYEFLDIDLSIVAVC